MERPLRLDRRVLDVSGRDAIKFLDSLLTQDVTRLSESNPLYAALLSPQGKVVADMLLWARGDNRVLIETDPSRAAELQRRLSMFKLRAEVQIDEVSLQALWAPDRFPGSRPDPRIEILGWRALAASASQRGDDAIAYEAHRIACGVPDLARDCEPEEVFALEGLLDELRGVDFKKGCFVGQENVSRMKRRATTRKKFCPIVFDGPAPHPGTPVSAGETLLGAVRTGLPGRALAMLRLDRALAAEAAGERLTAGDLPVRLAPPTWLHLPSGDLSSGAPD